MSMRAHQNFYAILLDNPKTVTPGYSVFNPDNPALTHGSGFIPKQLLKNLNKKQFPNTAITDLTNFTQVQRFCNAVQKFLDSILCLSHLTGGQPARGTELLSVQKSVLEAIMAGEPMVAYVAGTGSGKSLMFMLPACFPGYGQIIVVLPLGALRLDILSRCEELRIQASIWRAGGFNESASIVLVSPKNLGHADFPSYVRRQKALGRLEMIVMDEIHYIILPDQAYRPSLLNLQDIMQYSVRTVFMTATLPVCEQREAFRLLGLPSDTVAFREPTSRPNIQYTVTYIGSTKRWSTEKIANYNQEAGRAGRDGLPAVAEIVISSRIPNVFFEKADEKTRGRVEDYVQLVRQKPECRRRVLDRYFDGNKTRKMCVLPEEPCDLCAGEYYALLYSNYIRRVGSVVSHKSRIVNKDLEDAVPT
ncbi:hypothetical protein CFE70_001388 [Pyrenophora teres f. teres 0-1]